MKSEVKKNSSKRRYYYQGKRCSKGEKRIAEFLEDNKVQFEREKSFIDCLSLKGNRLRFDFYLPDFNVLIEFQGHHHFHPINSSYRARMSHKKTVVHDNIKQEFTQNKKIPLLEIAHWEVGDIHEILLPVIN